MEPDDTNMTLDEALKGFLEGEREFEWPDVEDDRDWDELFDCDEML